MLTTSDIDDVLATANVITSRQPRDNARLYLSLPGDLLTRIRSTARVGRESLSDLVEVAATPAIRTLIESMSKTPAVTSVGSLCYLQLSEDGVLTLRSQHTSARRDAGRLSQAQQHDLVRSLAERMAAAHGQSDADSEGVAPRERCAA